MKSKKTSTSCCTGSGVVRTYVTPPGLRYAQAVEAAIADWMRSLLLELDYVGYSLTLNDRGNIQVSHVLQRRRRTSHMFSSIASPEVLRKTGYLLMHQDLFESFEPYRQLEYVLNHIHHLRHEEQEQRLQQCLDRHPLLIRRGLFDRHWSQPVLRHPNPLKLGIVPDFILSPPNDRPWEVVEIKRAQRNLLDHGRPSRFLRLALEQLRLRYGSFFEDPSTAREQQRILGHVLHEPRYALVIGRRPQGDDAAALSEVLAQNPWHDVGIIQYDDLLDVGKMAFQAEARILQQVKSIE